MKKETMEFLVTLINNELQEELQHREETIAMFGQTNDIIENNIKNLLRAKIDLLSGCEGLMALVNKADIAEDLEKSGYTIKDLKKS